MQPGTTTQLCRKLDLLDDPAPDRTVPRSRTPKTTATQRKRGSKQAPARTSAATRQPSKRSAAVPKTTRRTREVVAAPATQRTAPSRLRPRPAEEPPSTAPSSPTSSPAPKQTAAPAAATSTRRNGLADLLHDPLVGHDLRASAAAIVAICEALTRNEGFDARLTGYVGLIGEGNCDPVVRLDVQPDDGVRRMRAVG